MFQSRCAVKPSLIKCHLGSISVSQGVKWSLQMGLMEWIDVLRGWGVGGLSCFNCLRSLADSLGLECCVTSSLAPSHSLARSLCLCTLSNSQGVHGKILRPDCRVSKRGQISQKLCRSRSSSLSHSSLSMTFLSDWPLWCSALCAHFLTLHVCLCSHCAHLTSLWFHACMV